MTEWFYRFVFPDFSFLALPLGQHHELAARFCHNSPLNFAASKALRLQLSERMLKALKEISVSRVSICTRMIPLFTRVGQG